MNFTRPRAPRFSRGFSILSTLVALGLGIAFAVAAVRWVERRFHGGLLPRLGLYAGILLGVVLVTYLGGAALAVVPKLKTTVEGSKLRLVLLAVTLIVLMLVRPQGVFAHHEFSWSWIGRLFGKKTPRTEVAA